MKDLLRQVQTEAARISEMTVKSTHVLGRHLVFGTGEALFYVPFPVWFCERPHFTVGMEMDTDFFVKSQQYPIWSAGINKWDVREKSNGFEGYYVGAEIYFTTTGDLEQQVWVNWKMEGKALRNPVSPEAAKRMGGDV